MLYLISYDLTRAKEAEYADLIHAIEAIGGKRVLFSEWLVPSDGTASELYRVIAPHLESKDRVLISEITKRSTWLRLRLSDADTKSLFSNARG